MFRLISLYKNSSVQKVCSSFIEIYRFSPNSVWLLIKKNSFFGTILPGNTQLRRRDAHLHRFTPLHEAAARTQTDGRRSHATRHLTRKPGGSQIKVAMTARRREGGRADVRQAPPPSRPDVNTGIRIWSTRKMIDIVMLRR